MTKKKMSDIHAVDADWVKRNPERCAEDMAKLSAEVSCLTASRERAREALRLLWNSQWQHVIPGTELEVKVRAALSEEAPTP